MCPSLLTAPHRSVFLHSALCPLTNGFTAQDKQQQILPNKELIAQSSRFLLWNRVVSLFQPQLWGWHNVGALDTWQQRPCSTARWQKADAMRGQVLALQPPYHLRRQPCAQRGRGKGRCHHFLLTGCNGVMCQMFQKTQVQLPAPMPYVLTISLTPAPGT